jgi:ketosteroid isomerase-like protein
MVLLLPLVPGRSEGWRRFIQELLGSRRTAYAESRRRLGITRELLWLQHTPQEEVVIVYLEAYDPAQSLWWLSRSQAPFDRWLRRKLHEWHGPVRLAAPLPELFLAWCDDQADDQVRGGHAGREDDSGDPTGHRVRKEAQMVAMVEQENTQMVMDLYAAFGRGDLPAVLAALADDVEWVVPGPADIPMAGTRRGKQAVQAWFGTVAANLTFQVFEPREFIAQGDTVVALIYAEATARRTDRTIAAHEAHVWTCRDGKITRHQAFQDTAAIAAAYRGA